MDNNQKGSFLLGFLISLSITILILIILAIIFLRNPEALGRITVYPFIGAFLCGYLSRKKKKTIIKIILLSLIINIIAFIISFLLLFIKM